VAQATEVTLLSTLKCPKKHLVTLNFRFFSITGYLSGRGICMQNYSILPYLIPCSRALWICYHYEIWGRARAKFCWANFFFVPILVFFGSQEAVKKFGPKIDFFVVWTSHISGIPTVNNRWNLNLRCPGETSDTYLTIDQKFIGVVSTETEIWFFKKKCQKYFSSAKYSHNLKI
jgi:hypothetical protein